MAIIIITTTASRATLKLFSIQRCSPKSFQPNVQLLILIYEFCGWLAEWMCRIVCGSWKTTETTFIITQMQHDSTTKAATSTAAAIMQTRLLQITTTTSTTKQQQQSTNNWPLRIHPYPVIHLHQCRSSPTRGPTHPLGVWSSVAPNLTINN